MKLVIATAFNGRPLACSWHYQMMTLEWPLNMSFDRLMSVGLSVEDSKNQMAQAALDMNAEYLLFIDDDVQPPASIISELHSVLEKKKKIAACGAICTTKSNPVEPIVFMGCGQGAYHDWTPGDIFKCWAVGLGCMMIRVSALRNLPKPWFKYLHTAEEINNTGMFPGMTSLPPPYKVSDSVYFCALAQKYGYEIWAHGGMLPIHWDTPVHGYCIAGGKDDKARIQGSEVEEIELIKELSAVS